MDIIPRLDVPLPRRMMNLPRDRRGWIVPWFVVWHDGKPVFPAFDPHKYQRATRRDDRRCWVCGDKLGRNFVFVIGPMCAINRVTAEPPCHMDCATYSAIVCPFLANPSMARVPEVKLPGGKLIQPGGEMDPGNPGVMCLWPTDEYRIMRTPTGPLIEFGEPVGRVSWWCRGREATAREASEGFQAGADKLLAKAQREGAEAVAEFDRLYIRARQALPDDEPVEAAP